MAILFVETLQLIKFLEKKSYFNNRKRLNNGPPFFYACALFMFKIHA